MPNVSLDSSTDNKESYLLGFGIGMVAFLGLAAVPFSIFSYNFFLFFHKLFYMGTHIPFKVPWTVFGLFSGAIIGAWAAKRRYRLESKWVWYPTGALLCFLFIFLLINGHRL